MTITQKILAKAAGQKSVKAGQLINAKLDMILGNDITAPVAINEFKAKGFEKVFDNSRIALVMDHFAPNKDIKAATLTKQCRCFAGEHSIKNFFDVGEMGIEHALLPEKGLAAPGECIIGADSHTCTYGALGAFSTGVGSTDMAAAMASGQAWFKVPSAIKFSVHGRLGKNVSGKDVILSIIGKIGVDGALYRSMEFCGDLTGLSIDDRFTIANMAIEAGAKNGIFEVDDITREYLNGRVERAYTEFSTDSDDDYDEIIDLDLSRIEPTVAFPHLPENARALIGIEENVRIDQAVIGSCTNGRITDMRTAAQILKGRHIAKGVRCIVIPATQQVYLDCIREGLAEIFINAGCALSTPTCGPCLGGHMGILAAGERAVSTTNRNFVGRMGDPKSEVYLASPAVAAAAALKGYIGKDIFE